MPGSHGDFCIGDGEMYSYTRYASQCLAILSVINTSRLFTEGSVIPPEHRLMLVNFHRKCIGNAKKAQWDRGIRLPCFSVCDFSHINNITEKTKWEF